MTVRCVATSVYFSGEMEFVPVDFTFVGPRSVEEIFVNVTVKMAFLNESMAQNRAVCRPTKLSRVKFHVMKSTFISPTERILLQKIIIKYKNLIQK